jgi:hypothetical protein
MRQTQDSKTHPLPSKYLRVPQQALPVRSQQQSGSMRNWKLADSLPARWPATSWRKLR